MVGVLAVIVASCRTSSGPSCPGSSGTVGIFMLLGLGLNIVVGYAGLLDLGYVAFFAFGAYATAILTGATRDRPPAIGRPAFSMHL